MWKQLFKTLPIEHLIDDSETSVKQPKMKRALGRWGVTALGIGAVIGTGIWTITGVAAQGAQVEVQSFWNASLLDLIMHGSDALGTHGLPGAGPAIVVSYLLAAIVCGFAALCYAEMASMIPVSGSTYTYSYATLGEIFAWLVGWDLILEYAVSNMATAVGFSGHFASLLANCGLTLPDELMSPLFHCDDPSKWCFNLPPALLVFFITVVLAIGIRETATANDIFVAIKIVAIVLFVVGAGSYMKTENLQPFMPPAGVLGVLSAAPIVFFCYIGFDAVSTSAEECKNPKKDVPFGILTSLFICSLLYVAVALVLIGVADYTKLDARAPVPHALKQLDLILLEPWVTIGILFGILSSVLVYQYGQARIWAAMSRNRLLPDCFARVHPQYRTPYISTWVAGFFVAIPAGMFQLSELAQLANIGTMFAFGLVCVGVWVLRSKRPELERGFRVPCLPIISSLGVLGCAVLMLYLPLMTWVRFAAWLVIGLLIYFGYSRRRSRLYTQDST
ncbi:MAG: amino acid permease [Nitrospira sp.]|nr:amino acid permease [Nitrospira sp.]